MSVALSPMSPVQGSGAPQKRGRGRPLGTGWKQQLALSGGLISGSPGRGFTPHVIMISVGKDISTGIMAFSQHRHRAIVILAASGALHSNSSPTCIFWWHYDL